MNKRLTKLAISASGAITSLPLMSTMVQAQALNDLEIEPGQGFATDIGSLINGILSFVMVIAALLVFAFLILGGIEWITSGGDKSKTESARNKITGAVVGLIILAASYAILLLLLNFLGFSNLGDVFDNVQNIN